MAIIPNKNLKDYELRNTLNKDGGKTDNVFGSKFRLLANINPYAKFKPERNQTLFELTNEMRKEDNYGYRIPELTDTTTIIEAYNGTTIPDDWGKPDDKCIELNHGWWYMLPHGGETEPFRNGDFRGYKSDSVKSLFGTIDVPATITQEVTRFRVTLNSGTFKFSDFSALNNMHLGVILSNGGSIRKFKSILSEESSSTQYNIDFSQEEISAIFGGNYGTTVKVYAFATAEEGQNILSDGDLYVTKLTGVVPLPVSVAQVTYKYQPALSLLTGLKWNVTITSIDRNNIEFNIKTTNEGEAARTLTLSSMKFSVSAWNDIGEWEQEYPRTFASGTVNVPIGATVDVGTFTVAYSAYKYLVEQWYAEVSLYYPNTQGEDSWFASAQSYYNDLE